MAAALVFALVLVLAVAVIAERRVAASRDTAVARTENSQNATIGGAVTALLQESGAMAVFLATKSQANRIEVGCGGASKP